MEKTVKCQDYGWGRNYLFFHSNNNLSELFIFLNCLLICYLGHFFNNTSSCTVGETVKIIKVLNMLFVQVTKFGDIDLCLHFDSHLNLFKSSQQISYIWELENALCSENLLCLLHTFAVVHET